MRMSRRAVSMTLCRSLLRGESDDGLGWRGHSEDEGLRRRAPCKDPEGKQQCSKGSKCTQFHDLEPRGWVQCRVLSAYDSCRLNTDR